jgi:hypothetical protein
MANLKTAETEEDALAFLTRACGDERKAECLCLLGLMERITAAKARMWGSSIVGFGKYHYRYESGREGEWFLMGFSPRKKDLTLYVMAGFAAFAALMARLGKFKVGKSCLYLKRLSDIDLSVLEELLRESTRLIAENQRSCGGQTERRS